MKAQGIPDFQAPPPIPKFIDTAQVIDELPSYDSFEPSLVAPLVQGNSGPAHFSVWFSLVVRMSQ